VAKLGHRGSPRPWSARHRGGGVTPVLGLADELDRGDGATGRGKGCSWNHQGNARAGLNSQLGGVAVTAKAGVAGGGGTREPCGGRWRRYWKRELRGSWTPSSAGPLDWVRWVGMGSMATVLLPSRRRTRRRSGRQGEAG